MNCWGEVITLAILRLIFRAAVSWALPPIEIGGVGVGRHYVAYWVELRTSKPAAADG